MAAIDDIQALEEMEAELCAGIKETGAALSRIAQAIGVGQAEIAQIKAHLGSLQGLVQYMRGQAQTVALAEFEQTRSLLDQNSDLLASREKEVAGLMRQIRDGQAQLETLKGQLAEVHRLLGGYGRLIQFRKP